MTEREYRASEGVSRSELWMLHTSPEKFKYLREHPPEPTPALIFGTAVHKLLLEPDTFKDEFAVAPEVDRRTKAGKEEWAEFCAKTEGKTVIESTQFHTCVDMVDVCLTNPNVVELLKGDHEMPLRWTDEVTGEVCKARVDVWNPEYKMIIDYKTTTNADTAAFARSAINYGYDFQAAMYCEGLRHVKGADAKFVFIAQEKDPPYAVNVMAVGWDVMSRGRDLYRDLLDRYHDCKESGDWYGYLGKLNIMNTLTLPGWADAEF